MKIKLIVAIIIIVVVILLFRHTAQVGKKMTALDALESIQVLSTAPAEYKALLTSQDKLSSYHTFISKTRNPILNVCYDKKYIIDVYSLDYNNNLPAGSSVCA